VVQPRRTAYCEVFAAVNYFGARLDSSLTMSQGEDEIFGSWFGQSSFATYAIASERNAVKCRTTSRSSCSGRSAAGSRPAPEA